MGGVKTADEWALIAGMEEIPQAIAARLVYSDWLREHGREDEAEFLSVVRMTGDEFSKAIVGQNDDEDYEESGWVACRVERGGRSYGLIASYGHCSCYDTWTSLCGGGISDHYPGEQTMEPGFDWVGTWEGLQNLARAGVNPRTGKPIAADGYEDRWLTETYQDLLSKAKGPVPS